MSLLPRMLCLINNFVCIFVDKRKTKKQVIYESITLVNCLVLFVCSHNLFLNVHRTFFTTSCKCSLFVCEFQLIMTTTGIERRDELTYMGGKNESICMYDIHIECILGNTHEYVLECYQGSYQYVMYLGIWELTYISIHSLLTKKPTRPE